MSLDFDDGQEVVPDLYDQIPILGRPEITRQGFVGDVDVCIGKAGIAENIGDEADEPVTMLASGYGRSAAGILLPARAALSLLLAGADPPEMTDRFGKAVVEVKHGSPCVAAG
jgi:hypothetical protein